MPRHDHRAATHATPTSAIWVVAGLLSVVLLLLTAVVLVDTLSAAGTPAAALMPATRPSAPAIRYLVLISPLTRIGGHDQPSRPPGRSRRDSADAAGPHWVAVAVEPEPAATARRAARRVLPTRPVAHRAGDRARRRTGHRSPRPAPADRQLVPVPAKEIRLGDWVVLPDLGQLSR